MNKSFKMISLFLLVLVTITLGLSFVSASENVTGDVISEDISSSVDVDGINNADEDSFEGENSIIDTKIDVDTLSKKLGCPVINTISISADGATYNYNYDPDGTYKANNYTELLGTSMWSDTTNSDPITDVMNAQDAVEAATGTRPSILLVSKQTMNYLKQNVKVRDYTLSQNVTANIIMTDNRVKELCVEAELPNSKGVQREDFWR